MKTSKRPQEFLKNLAFLFFIIYFGFGIASSMQFIAGTGLFESSKRVIYVAIISSGFYAIWWLLASVYINLQHYTKLIKGSKEEPAFSALAKGTLGLFVSTIITAFVNIIRSPQVNYETYKYLTLIIYYGSAIMAMYYFFYVGKAGYILAGFVKRKMSFQYVMLNLTIAVAFCCFVFWQALLSRTMPELGVDHILSYLPANTVLFTLLLPLILVWSFGLTGAYGFYLFYRHSGGVIYSHAFISLCCGVVLMVLLSVSRHMSSYFSGNISQTSLSGDFVKVLFLLGLGVVSIYCIRQGLVRLLTIENAVKQK